VQFCLIYPQKKIVRSFKEHKSKVNAVIFHPSEDMLFTGSSDKTAKIWKRSADTSVQTVKVHSGEVLGCSLHPTGSYWVTASADRLWAFHDIESGTSLVQTDVGVPLKCIQFHPDGLILGTGGRDGVVKVWDIKSLQEVASFAGTGEVVSISFSENGYYLATATADNSVKLWDLRKTKNFQTVQLGDFNLSTVRFDSTGTYLGVTGSELRIYVAKTLTPVASFSKHSQAVTGVAWRNDTKSLVSVSLDRSTKVWGKKD